MATQAGSELLRDICLETAGVIDDEENDEFILIGPRGEMVTLNFDDDGDDYINWKEIPIC